MELISFKDIRGLETISDEGYILGNVADIRYNPETWKVKGIRINQSSRFKTVYPEFRSKVLIAPSTKFRVSDVFLLNFTTAELKSKITTDNDTIDMVSNMIGKKVITKDNVLLGTMEAVQIDVEKWTIVSTSVKLDKDAHAPLGIKKLLFNKTVSGVQTSYIRIVSETIPLNVTLEQLKKNIIVDD